MQSLGRLIAFILLAGLAVLPAHAAFSSLYVFGDGVSTTTNNPSAGSYYHGLRRSNGRVWVEVLAQRQALPNNTITNVDWSYSSNNWSFYGHYSSNLVANVNSFIAPPDANTALFVVWVSNADFVDDMGAIYPAYGTNLAQWTNAINRSLTNHFQALTNLLAKGARTLIVPNAVDITAIPQFNGSPAADRSFIRQRVIDFNTAFTTSLIPQLRTNGNYPNLAIYVPDFFTLLDNLLARPADYGLTNALYQGHSIDALEDPSLSDRSLRGPGTNYIFWDAADPTAKVHAIMADTAQQLLSPARISDLTLLSGSNRLEAANLPVGLSGFVEGRTSVASGNWTSLTNFNSTSTAQTIFAPASQVPQFYRLRFPLGWSWP